MIVDNLFCSFKSWFLRFKRICLETRCFGGGDSWNFGSILLYESCLSRELLILTAIIGTNSLFCVTIRGLDSRAGRTWDFLEGYLRGNLFFRKLGL